MNPDCCCPPQCTEGCTPDRTCADAACLCFRMWSIEIDAAIDATAHLSSEEIHQMMLDGLRDAGWLRDDQG